MCRGAEISVAMGQLAWTRRGADQVGLAGLARPRAGAVEDGLRVREFIRCLGVLETG